MKKVKQIASPKWFIHLPPIGLVLYLLYSAINYKNILSGQMNYSYIFMSLILLIILSLHTCYHEHSHSLMAKFLGYNAKPFVKKKICVIKGFIKPIDFIWIAIMPFLVDLLIFLLMIIFFSTQTFLIGIFDILWVGASLSDLYVAILAIPLLGEVNLFLRYKRRGRFLVKEEVEKYRLASFK